MKEKSSLYTLNYNILGKLKHKILSNKPQQKKKVNKLNFFENLLGSTDYYIYLMALKWATTVIHHIFP